MDLQHELRLVHRRTPVSEFGRHESNSTVDVEATSTDLTETWRELLSRLPSDVYAALKVAMGVP